MATDNVIYLDNAATTFPKPKSVYTEVARCISEYCGNPGRGGHSMSAAATEAVYGCREKLADMFGAPGAENVVFTLNTTYAVNMAIKGLVRQGDHVIISNIEHNAVYRCLNAIGVDYDIFNSYAPKESILADIDSLINKKTGMVICNHASNICPVRNPIEAIGSLCRQRKLMLIVDGAQSAGIHRIDMVRMGIDALCLPSHKGLYGIQGCGAVIFSKRFAARRARRISTLVEGGNGVNSNDRYMPDLLPERLEAGTLPTPAIAALSRGIDEVNRIGISAIRDHENRLYSRGRELLANDPAIELYCPEFTGGQILLFNVKGMSPALCAQQLSDKGVCVRGGYHCCPLGHNAIGTPEGGAVRISFGAFNTLEEVDKAYGALREIIENQ